MKEHSENFKLESLVLVIAVLLLIPLLVLGMYNRASADDYAYSLLTHQAYLNGEGFFGIVKAAWQTNLEFYQTWQGLYTSAFLLAFQPGLFGEQYYVLTTSIMILIPFLFLLGSIHIVNKYFVRKSFLFTLTSTLVLLDLLMFWLPCPNEALFWFNGAVNYYPWAFSNLFIICCMYEIYHTIGKFKGKLLLILVTILSFITSGANHVTAFANILFLFSILVFCIRKKRYYPLIPLLVACVGFVLVLKAPGTAVRQAYFEHPSIIKALVRTAGEAWFFLTDWLSLDWVFSIVIITPVALHIIENNREKMPEKFPWYPILVSAIVICGMLGLPYYAMIFFGEGRLTNVVWVTFMFLSWIDYTLIIGWWLKKKEIRITKIKNYQLICFAVIVLCMLGSFTMRESPKRYSSSMKAILEITEGTAQSFKDENDKRIEQYLDDSLTEVLVKPLKTRDTILFFDDIGPDPTHWPNSAISDYYHKTIYSIPE